MLCIRSQDKTFLGKVERIYIKNNFMDKTFDVFGYDYIFLGSYKTKERALEVLDEIKENIVKQGQTIILTDERGIPNGSKFFSYVYEMPEE